MPASLVLGAAHLASRPVDGEVGLIEAAIHTSLPRHAAASGPDEVDAVPLARFDKQPGTHIGAVHKVLGRQKSLDREPGVNGARAPRRMFR